MIRLLTLASLLLIAALAVNAQGAECDAGDDPEACQDISDCGAEEGAEAQCVYADVPSAPCDDACAYGEESCTWCSGPIVDDEAAAPTHNGVDDGEAADQSNGAAGVGLLAGLAALGAALVAWRRK